MMLTGTYGSADWGLEARDLSAEATSSFDRRLMAFTPAGGEDEYRITQFQLRHVDRVDYEGLLDHELSTASRNAIREDFTQALTRALATSGASHIPLPEYARALIGRMTIDSTGINRSQRQPMTIETGP
jgi:hypothetical protein